MSSLDSDIHILLSTLQLRGSDRGTIEKKCMELKRLYLQKNHFLKKSSELCLPYVLIDLALETCNAVQESNAWITCNMKEFQDLKRVIQNLLCIRSREPSMWNVLIVADSSGLMPAAKLILQDWIRFQVGKAPALKATDYFESNPHILASYCIAASRRRVRQQSIVTTKLENCFIG